MKKSYNHAKRGYAYRRCAVALAAFMPIWVVYCFIGTQSLLFTLLSALVVVVPTAGIAGALLTVADSELEIARHKKEDNK